MNPSDDAPGDGFINLDVTSIRFTHDTKSAVNNVLNHLGGKKPPQRTEAYRQMLVFQLLNMIPFAAKLTRNEEHHIACCIDVATVRGYNLKEKHYELPPFHVGKNRSNTLHAQMVAAVKECYEKYCNSSEAEYNALKTTGGYMESTDWSVLESLLGEVTRFCIKNWILKPDLSRKEACENAVDTLMNNFKKRGDCKRIIDEMLLEKKMAGVAEDLFALETETVKYDGKDAKVFKENETAQTIITSYLNLQQFKWDKRGTLDVIVALQNFINERVKTAEKPKFRMFAGMVPKRTAAYIDKLNKQTKAAEAKEAKKREQEKKKAELEKNKRRKLEDAKKKLQQENKKAEARKAAAPPNEVDTEGGGTEAESPEAKAAKQAIAALEASNEYDEYKLAIKQFTIVSKPSAKCGSRKSARQEAHDQSAGITKVLDELSDDGKLIVSYVKPGELWQQAMMARIGNVVTAINQYCIDEPVLVHQCMPQAESTGYDRRSGRVVLGLMLHATAKKDTDLKRIRLHPSFHEPTFTRDLKNTVSLWLPNIFRGSLTQLACLHELTVSSRTIAGISLKRRVSDFFEFLKSKRSLTIEQGKQVADIVHLLYALRREIDLDQLEETRDLYVDPFNTICSLYD